MVRMVEKVKSECLMCGVRKCLEHACKAAWAGPPQLLSVGRQGLAVIFDMRLCCFSSVVGCVLMVSMSQMRVMRSCLVFPCFMVLCGFLVVSRRMFVMLCCLVMMFCCFS